MTEIPTYLQFPNISYILKLLTFTALENVVLVTIFHMQQVLVLELVYSHWRQSALNSAGALHIGRGRGISGNIYYIL